MSNFMANLLLYFMKTKKKRDKNHLSFLWIRMYREGVCVTKYYLPIHVEDCLYANNKLSPAVNKECLLSPLAL